jgi:hypothetical protein
MADDCIEWTGQRLPSGYGRVWDPVRKRRELVHRIAYAETFGPIPDGMCVCHTCDNPPCHNPAHLWLGTKADNNRDRAAKGRSGARGKKDSCKAGHPLSGDNLRVTPNGTRQCRTCGAEAKRRRRMLGLKD